MAKNRFDNLFGEADTAFNNDNNYQEKLNSFKGLTEAQIDLLTPDTTSKDAYNKLTKLVDQATKTNMSQADLITNIKSLGDIAKKIAKKVPELASLF